MSFKTEVNDQAVQEMLNRVVNAVEHPAPGFQAIGEDIVARIKERFSAATGPDGKPWTANSPVTLARYIQSRGGKNFKKDGSLNKRGEKVLAAKKPLQGITGDLAREFHISANDVELTIGNAMIYAAMQQLGGRRSEFPNLWGDIPARPFFPITATGELYPQERDLIVAGLARYIEGSVAG